MPSALNTTRQVARPSLARAARGTLASLWRLGSQPPRDRLDPQQARAVLGLAPPAPAADRALGAASAAEGEEEEEDPAASCVAAYATLSAAFGAFAALAVFAPFPIATVPSLLGKRLVRAYGGSPIIGGCPTPTPDPNRQLHSSPSPPASGARARRVELAGGRLLLHTQGETPGRRARAL